MNTAHSFANASIPSGLPAFACARPMSVDALAFETKLPRLNRLEQGYDASHPGEDNA